MKRPLSRQQIHAQSDALRTLEGWEDARAFAGRVYGSRAHTIIIDQVFTEPDLMSVKFSLKASIETWRVLDKEGQPVEADLTLDFWQPHLPAIQRALGRGTARSIAQEIIHGEITRALPAEEVIYALDQPPSLPFHALYADKGQTDGQAAPPSPPTSEVEEIDWEKSYPITGITRGDLKTHGFTEQEIASLTDLDMNQIARNMADVYIESRYWIDLDILARSILERV